VSSTILAVDDEESINDLICDALSLAGYQTIRARHGMEALHILREQSVDLVILDVNMPNVDGFEVLRRLRESGDATPVIILTARQDRDDTKRGFELGADDFVRKPFGLEELTLRVAAVLRRSSAPSTARTLAVGRIVLDEEQHRATCDGATVELSPTEFRLLALLMRHAGKVMTKEQLLGQVWGISGGAETTVVETYVSYLRRKFGEHISIRTVRAVGYQMVEPGTAR
jgi:two-component system OmpR family response regulator